MGRREYDEAIAQHTKAIELRPDFAEAYNNRGYAVYSKYDGSDPLADLNRAIELRPNFAHAYNTCGCIYMTRGQADLANADFGRAIALQPDYPRAYRNRANVLMKQGRVREAFADFERAGINPWKVAGILRSILIAFLPQLSACEKAGRQHCQCRNCRRNRAHWSCRLSWSAQCHAPRRFGGGRAAPAG